MGVIQTNDMAYLEELVKRLYQPGSPGEIAQVEKALQSLQRSEQGWQFADTLLQSQETNTRFFGALTFTIKINQDWDSLTEADAIQLLYRLIEWLIELTRVQDSTIVIRKLCSALIAYYLRPSGVWKQCIQHLILSFNAGHPIPIDQLSAHQPTTTSSIDTLSFTQVQTILWFASGLVEEVSKADSASIRNYKYSNRVSSNTADVIALMRHSIEAASKGHFKLAQLGVKCFQSWVIYAHRGWVDTGSEMESLRHLTPLALESLRYGKLFGVIMELFIDILDTFSAFLTTQDLWSLSVFLTTEDAQNLVAKLKKGDFDMDTLLYPRLMLAYGKAVVNDLATKPDNPQIKQLLYQLLELLQCSGFGDVENELCSGALEFWVEYTGFVVDTLYDIDDSNEEDMALPWLGDARQHIEAALVASWHQIQAPSSHLTEDWDAEAQSNWASFRKDMHDFLEPSYTVLGEGIFIKFAELALKSLADRAWLSLEATLYCLNALLDSISGEHDKATVDEILQSVLGPDLFATLANLEDDIPMLTKRTAVTMISNYSSFFERRAENLPSMLNCLFMSLRSGSSTLANAAAKAIFSTCSSCRKALTSELGAFLQQYRILMAWEGFEISTKEKIIGAIAAIVEALPTDEEKVAPLAQLVQFVVEEATSCVTEMGALEVEKSEGGLSALKCLASIGRSLQAPADAVINVDAEDLRSTFWTTGQGALLQVKVIAVVETITRLFKYNSDIIDAGCQVLRVGYKETTPGLFVFPIKVTVDFVLASGIDTARLDQVLATATVMLASRFGKGEAEVRNAASSILGHLLEIFATINYDPSSDPEASAAAVELVDNMIPSYLGSLMTTPNIQLLFDFMLRSLTVPEIMPKRSAAQFWGNLMQSNDLSQEVDYFVQSVVGRYGPIVCQILVRQIAGEASRSELSWLSEPLKKLVRHQRLAKTWLSEALNSDTFPSPKVNTMDKRIWLSKVMSLRGAQATNNVVRDFWIQCRGAEFSYTS